MAQPQATSNPSPPTDVAHAPPPWVLKAKFYLFTRLLSPGSREDPILKGIPPGSYSPEETVHPSALAPEAQWKGGLSHVVLIRYEDSPIGAYDELIAVSDGWSNPYEKRTSARITNTYVSTRQSIWNGRHNWNIPKRLARFEFVQTDSKTCTFKVFLPDAENPFFAATVTNSSLPGIPLPPLVLDPFMRIVQPPLVSGASTDVQIGSEDEWLTTTPLYRGLWRPAYIRPAEAGPQMYGDGVHFPRCNPYWIGTKFTGSIHFSVGDRVNRKID